MAGIQNVLLAENFKTEKLKTRRGNENKYKDEERQRIS